ncbi:hypothetical protein SLEP1_g46330 [Rubroshorea leprosula]|uniref:Uncharacterized protein n=1 Tax=Rubroshorea leprosula TaxID=152421 RepID=A0AAV5LLW1_9ROSI|nr:hypothetical protein SLEP1_g46330 [Rubroshorea leprosula]
MFFHMVLERNMQRSRHFGRNVSVSICCAVRESNFESKCSPPTAQKAAWPPVATCGLL